MNDRGIKFGLSCSFIAWLLALALLGASSIALAADEVRVETILNDLRSPAGIGIRPIPGAEHYEIYVAEVAAGRIVRLRSNKPNASEDAITGFIASTDEDDLVRLPGPHGLLFLDPNRLVVAGSEGESRPFVRLYELADQKKPLTAEQHEQEAAPAASEEKWADKLVSFFSLNRTLANDKVSDFLVVSAADEDGAATLWKLPVRSGTIGDLSPLGKRPPAVAPVAIAVEPHGFIAVVRPDGRGDSAVSRLEFVNPMDGRTTSRFEIKLASIVGVAYSPRTGNLYAISQSSNDPAHSGVYRIDSDETSTPNEPSATASLVTEVQRPTAIAFGPDGSLYVTALGKERSGGLLQKVTGGL
jgi:hypothetical protein